MPRIPHTQRSGDFDPETGSRAHPSEGAHHSRADSPHPADAACRSHDGCRHGCANGDQAHGHGDHRHGHSHGETHSHCHDSHDHGHEHHGHHDDHHGPGHGRPRPIQRGILLAAFGVAIPEARGGLLAVEAEVRDRYPDCAVNWAFTAHKVRRKMARRGFPGDSVAEALSRMHDEGVTHLAVQSLHTVPGVEYHWTRDQAMVYLHPRKGFLDVKMGRPLLESDDDLQRARTALADYIPAERKPNEAVVLVGHGTYHAGHRRYLDFQTCLNRCDPLVFVGALMGRPGCDDILSSLRETGSGRVWLLPFMSVPGHHVRVDIYGDHDRSWKQRMIAAGLTVETRRIGTLEHPGFREIWMDHLKSAFEALPFDE